jgi:hypothetical protein
MGLGSGIRYPGSGKKPIPDPGPGSRSGGQKDWIPDSQHCFFYQPEYYSTSSSLKTIVGLPKFFSYESFQKIFRDIRNSRCSTSVNDSGGHIFLILTFIAVSPAANLPPMSLLRKITSSVNNAMQL